MSAGVAVVLSLGLLVASGFAAQGTATGEGTDAWLTFKTKLALLGDERVSSNDVSVKTVKGVFRSLGGLSPVHPLRRGAASYQLRNSTGPRPSEAR
jgi:hypothetical protein